MPAEVEDATVALLKGILASQRDTTDTTETTSETKADTGTFTSVSVLVARHGRVNPHEIIVEFEAGCTVADIKRKLQNGRRGDHLLPQEEENIPVEEQTLVSKGDQKVMEDTNEMSDYDFKDPDTGRNALVLWRTNPSPPAEFKLAYKFQAIMNIVEVKSNDRIIDVKERVMTFARATPQFLAAAKTDVTDTAKAHVFFCGRRLGDTEKLSDCHIGPDSIIHIMTGKTIELTTLCGNRVVNSVFEIPTLASEKDTPVCDEC